LSNCFDCWKKQYWNNELNEEKHQPFEMDLMEKTEINFGNQKSDTSYVKNWIKYSALIIYCYDGIKNLYIILFFKQYGYKRIWMERQ